MSKRHLLIVAHQPSENARAMAKAILAGARQAEIESVETKLLKPPDAGADDVIWADGVIIGSTENFGYMAGLVKDFLERIYYPCLERTAGLPCTLYIRAGNDGLGAKTSIERIIIGLKWKLVQEPIICPGEFQQRFIDQCTELGMTMAVGLEVGIF